MAKIKDMGNGLGLTTRDYAVLVAATMEAQLEHELASAALRGKTEPLQVLKVDGSLERLLKASIDEFLSAKEVCGRDALVSWLTVFETYLLLHLPTAAQDLYTLPLRYLAAALSDLDHGFVCPLLKRAPIASRPSKGRPSDSQIAATFRINCVLAADEVYQAGRLPGQKRSRVSREDADGEILRRVKKAATALGFSMGGQTIGGWRRLIREAPANGSLKKQYQRTNFIIKKVRAARGSDYVLKFLLVLLTDPRYIV